MRRKESALRAFENRWIVTIFAVALVVMSALTVGFCVFTIEKALWPALLSGALGLWLAWEANKKIESAREAWETYLHGGPR